MSRLYTYMHEFNCMELMIAQYNGTNSYLN